MTTRRQKTSQKAKEIRDKLKKLNPSLYNRKTGERKSPRIVPGGPFKPENKKNPVPGGPYKPEKGPKYMKPMSLKGGPVTKDTKKRSLAGGPKPKKFNVGGQAAESLRKGTLFKEKRDKRRKSVDDMIQRLYGPKIKPKPKPKKPLKKVLGDKIKPTLKKKPINPKTRKPKGFGFKGPQGGGKLTRE